MPLLRYALRQARPGLIEASRQNPGIALGVNMAEGRVSNEAVADSSNGFTREPLTL